ncbi:MAG: ABC transporter substrate-binding protein [Candidatus Methanoplasma sp.]|jgi:iron complex transport system substrate-binding protein|nr:ABC transporter substrate-binding protein [Candidatus Methanoplasma sp.]
MKSSKIFAVVAVAIIVVAGIGIAAYSLSKNDNSDSDGETIIDARGREVLVPKDIDSILGIKSCSLELISFFEIVNKVKYLDVNESFEDKDRTHTLILEELLKDLPRVDPKSAEQVIAADPDLIISSTVSVADLDEEQNKYGIPVFAINADLEFGEEFDKQLTVLGEVFGEKGRAAQLVSGINSTIKNIQNKLHLPGSATDATAYACGMNFYGAGTFTKTSGDYQPFTYNYVTNVSPSSTAGVGKQPYNISEETAISYNPQYIFIDSGGLDETVKYINGHKSTVGKIDAIKNGDVYSTMVYKAWGTNWLNQLVNIYYVAEVIYGYFGWTVDKVANDTIQLFYPGTEITYADIAAAQSGNGCARVTL